MIDRTVAARPPCGAPLACLAVLLALAGCGQGSKGSEASARPQAQAPRPVRLARVAAVPIPRAVLVTGTLRADDEVTVGMKVPGRLAAVFVDLGTPVKKGQPIAQVETIDFELRVAEAESALAHARALAGPAPAPDGPDALLPIEETGLVREARATLDEARANLERARSLDAQHLISPADLELANAAFLRAEAALQRAREEMLSRRALVEQRRAELRLARQQLEDATVRAPLDGAVRIRHASPGEILAAGAPVATIVRLSPLRLRAEVPERDAGNVRVGQTVRVRVDGQEGTHEGKVARLSPAIGEANRVLVIEAEIENPGHLRPGGFARAEIVVDDDRPVPAIPASAVVTFAGIEKVILVADGKAVEREVRTGRRAGELVEVLKGLAPGEAVVAEPGNLQHGQAVVVEGEGG